MEKYSKVYIRGGYGIFGKIIDICGRGWWGKVVKGCLFAGVKKGVIR